MIKPLKGLTSSQESRYFCWEECKATRFLSILLPSPRPRSLQAVSVPTTRSHKRSIAQTPAAW